MLHNQESVVYSPAIAGLSADVATGAAIGCGMVGTSGVLAMWSSVSPALIRRSRRVASVQLARICARR